MRTPMAAKKLPRLKPDAPKRKPDAYRSQHAVLVVCDGEAEQRAVYEGLKTLAGVKLRVVAT